MFRRLRVRILIEQNKLKWTLTACVWPYDFAHWRNSFGIQGYMSFAVIKYDVGACCSEVLCKVHGSAAIAISRSINDSPDCSLHNQN